jgi:hypothetical protein
MNMDNMDAIIFTITVAVIWLSCIYPVKIILCDIYEITDPDALWTRVILWPMYFSILLIRKIVFFIVWLADNFFKMILTVIVKGK